MTTKAVLEARLAVVVGFKNSEVSPEQCPTPSDLAARLARLTGLRNDIKGATILGLGPGAEMLGLGAAPRSPVRVVDVELDDDVLTTVADNVRRVGTSAPIDWIRADATHLPPCPPDDRQVTTLMNLPLGAQCGNEHADRIFLDLAASAAGVSYSVHNGGSKGFVESFIADIDSDLTDASQVTSDPGRQFDFHDEDHRQLNTEVFRIEW